MGCYYSASDFYSHIQKLAGLFFFFLITSSANVCAICVCVVRRRRSNSAITIVSSLAQNVSRGSADAVSDSGFQVWGEMAFSKRRLSVSALTPSITASAVCLSIHTAGCAVYSRYCQTEEDACQSLSSVSSALAPSLQDALLLPLVLSLFVLYSLQSPSVCCYLCSSRLH